LQYRFLIGELINTHITSTRPDVETMYFRPRREEFRIKVPIEKGVATELVGSPERDLID
jgi:hypothetical protein